ncbi:MAG: hypothetical protein HFG28_04630 [Eubacterium sp.]|nr:hypothetical protein [Eubacterium sp.]
MRQTRKLKRKRRRRLKKGVKIFLIGFSALIALIMIVMFGFQLQNVKISLDLGQYTSQEVKSYMDAKGIDNTLLFWLKNKTGHSVRLELLEEYDVKILSPFSAKIIGYEKKLKGFVQKDDMNYYFDENGSVLKISQDKIKDIPVVDGLEVKGLKIYEKIKVTDKKSLQSLLDVTSSIEKYSFPVKRIKINSSNEVTIYIKKVQVQLGKTMNLDKKLEALNDMYSKVIQQSGILNMKYASEDGSYTLKKTQKKHTENK